MDVQLLHEYCNDNKDAISKSVMCGCCFCCEIYNSQQVCEYVDNNTCALCPKCGIDSVLPDINCQVTIPLLVIMHKFWFNNHNQYK